SGVLVKPISDGCVVVDASVVAHTRHEHGRAVRADVDAGCEVRLAGRPVVALLAAPTPYGEAGNSRVTLGACCRTKPSCARRSWSSPGKFEVRSSVCCSRLL